MVPSSIRRLLSRLRWRERWLGATWAASGWFAGLLAVFAVACVADYLIDRHMETPAMLHGLAFAAKAVLLLGLLAFVINALAKLITDRQAALWVEAATPGMRHRLISAVELNQPDARTEGMSGELIAAVTRQAEQQASAIRPSEVLDSKRLHWTVMVLGPVLFVCAALYALSPMKAWALLQRQFLQDVEVPRSLEIATPANRVWPASEPGEIHFEVRGEIPNAETKGEVTIRTDDGAKLRVPLEQVEANEDAGVAKYRAMIPPLEVAFRYSAKLADGRTRKPGRVEYVPRPVVTEVVSEVVLPASLGIRGDGQRYAERQKGGDIVYRVPGSQGRVRVRVQRPIATARLHITGAMPRTLVRKAKGERAEWVFDFAKGDRGFEIEVIDEHGIANLPPWPRRSISSAALDPPEVVLLPETLPLEELAGLADFEDFSDAPVYTMLPMAYRASSRYGIASIRLRYRVLPRPTTKDKEKDKESDTGPLELDKFRIQPPLGPPKGRKSEWTTRKTKEDEVPDTEGEGRYDLNLKGIRDDRPEAKGELMTLAPGDRIQFYIEAFSRADPEGVPGRSVVREKEVSTLDDLVAWAWAKADLAKRTRELEERQRENRPALPATPKK